MSWKRGNEMKVKPLRTRVINDVTQQTHMWMALSCAQFRPVTS